MSLLSADSMSDFAQQPNNAQRASTLIDFEILKSLGTGSYSSVFLVKRKKDQRLYALKKVKIAQMGERDRHNALNEVRILASIRHPNVI